MSLFKNVIRFTQRASTGTPEDLQLGAFLTAWIMYVNANTRNPKTSEFQAPVVLPPQDKIAGRLYHYWLRLGLLNHISGFDYAQHYVRVTNNWLADTFETINVDAYTDENGVEHEAEVITVTNADHFKPKHINSTHGLVKITDENYSLIKVKIQHTDNMPTNIYAQDKYYEAIAEGGEFYTEPEEV